MIHYISPYDSSPAKNIGGAINKAITQLAANSEDWIALTDYDVLWLLPDSKSQVEQILSTTDYDLLGAVTNRLAMPYQLHQGMFDIYDIRHHIEVAKSRRDMAYSEVEPYTNILAACCLCFRVSTWQTLGQFEENSLQFDSLFSIKARAMGMKLGLMLGVYVYHIYRTGSAEPLTDITHLLPVAE